MDTVPQVRKAIKYKNRGIFCSIPVQFIAFCIPAKRTINIENVM